MKKIAYIIVTILIVLIVSSWFGSKGPEVSIGNHTWTVEVADTNAKKELGLSGREYLPEKTGMIFLFETPDSQKFWMKDMRIPIDMIFIDENWKIVLIEENISPETFPDIFGGEVISKYVLEIGALEAEKSNLEVGNQVFFRNR